MLICFYYYQTCLDPAIRMSFVQLRTDFKTARLHLNTANQMTTK